MSFISCALYKSIIHHDWNHEIGTFSQGRFYAQGEVPTQVIRKRNASQFLQLYFLKSVNTELEIVSPFLDRRSEHF